MEIKDFFAGSKTGIFTVNDDENFTIIDADNAFLQAAGFADARKKSGLSLRQCVSERDFPLIRKAISEAESAGDTEAEVELGFNKGSGAILWGMFCFSLNHKADDHILHGLLHDISHLKRSFQTLKDYNDMLRIAMEKLSAITWEYDFETKAITGNNPLFNGIGKDGIIPDVSETFLKKGFIHPDSLFPYLEMHEALQRGEPECSSEIRIKIKAPDYRWYRINYTTIYDDETCEPTKAFGLATDINDQKERQLQYLMDMQYHDAMVSDALYLMEINLSRNLIIKADRRIKNRLGDGYTSAYRELISAMADSFVLDADRTFFKDMLSKEYLVNLFRTQMPNFTFEYRSMVTQGEVLWCRVFVNFILEPLQGDICMLMYARNINDEKLREEDLKEGAERDSLTKLLNRAAVQHRIDAMLSHNIKESRSSALFMIDLDDFKLMNDTCGHLYGDAVLCEMATRIKKVFKETEVVGRVGGDEFTVFVPEVSSLDFIREKAEEVCRSLAAPMKFDARNHSISGSVGISVSPQCGLVFKDLYEKADEALYKAKANGKNCFYLYNN